MHPHGAMQTAPSGEINCIDPGGFGAVTITVTMSVRESTLANNRGSGINSTAGNAILLMVDRDTISSNFQNGVVSSGGNSVVRINASAITGNATGVISVAGGVLRSYKNNAINGNGVDGTPIVQELIN